ncbi:hypothetical protein ACQF36_41480 [Streptomyces sp. Marseille-Q5077]|uniref:hypothetical protein n=1 Tax=Streptomyces sp. Marseille-Q5077 TaxID=3418995 RepID=UPI003D02470F
MSAVTIPGALADYLADQFISDNETTAALDAARRGRGSALVIEPTSTRVLHVISRFAERILAVPSIRTRAQRDAAHLWIKRAGNSPARMTHEFSSTGIAYNHTQSCDGLRDGDVLVIKAEQVVGILVGAYPAAITKTNGDLHTLTAPAREVEGGAYAASAEAAEQVARDLGFPLAGEPAEETEATVITWRGDWIGEQPAGDTLFDVEPAAEQGALFTARRPAWTRTRDITPRPPSANTRTR